jgi:hypothetical protein
MDSAITLAILAFIAFAIPVVGALWRIFSVREALQTAIAHNSHRLDLLEQKIEHLVDQQGLAINGIKENLQHVRARSAQAEKELADRLNTVERFLDKTTEFSPRGKD